MNRIEATGADMGYNECIFEVTVYDENGKDIGTAWGERNARLFARAEEMYELVKKTDSEEAEAIVDWIENSPELKLDGLTAEEIRACTV